MNKFNWKALLRALITAAVFTAMVSSCENPAGGGGGDDYPSATARVDYNGAKRAVFFDFSSGKTTELPLDFFDIAIFPNQGGSPTVQVIANSGSYGSGVTVAKTTSTDIGDDLSSQYTTSTWNTAPGGAIGAGKYTFKTGTNLYNFQTVANPLDDAFTNQGAGSANIYIVKTATTFYKVKFNSFGPMGAYSLDVVTGLDGAESAKVTIGGSGTLSGIGTEYGLIWLKFDGTEGPRALNTGSTLATGAPDIPKITDWDLLCTRTNELQPGEGDAINTTMPVAPRSSILLNTYKGVKVYKAEGKSMEEVLTKEGLTESGDIDAIGHGWYSSGPEMPPVNSANKNTYVVKTVEGKYAKFQPGSFYGPNNESFYMQFRYLYGDNSGTFAK